MEEAKHLVNICLESGINFFDTANVYSKGMSETSLGETLQGKRHQAIISTKAAFPMSDDVNDFGSSRYSLIKNCEESLRRLQTDYIDIYHLHGFDATTPVEETLRALNDLITSGKVRYIACSNFSGWHLMKSLSVSEKYGWAKYTVQQSLYSIYDRDFEWELMPLGIDQKIGTMVWSPLSSGRLGGRFNRNKPIPPDNRLSTGGADGPPTNFERLYKITDVLGQISSETEKSIAQVALNWVLQRPTIANIIIGARNEDQLKENIGALGWKLSEEQISKIDDASQTFPAYPYWHQRNNHNLNPPPKEIHAKKL